MKLINMITEIVAAVEKIPKQGNVRSLWIIIIGLSAAVWILFKDRQRQDERIAQIEDKLITEVLMTAKKYESMSEKISDKLIRSEQADRDILFAIRKEDEYTQKRREDDERDR